MAGQGPYPIGIESKSKGVESKSEGFESKSQGIESKSQGIESKSTNLHVFVRPFFLHVSCRFSIKRGNCLKEKRCFAIKNHLEHEFSHETYLELKISIGAFDCLNITSVSLLGCSFVPKQGPTSKEESLFRHKRSF